MNRRLLKAFAFVLLLQGHVCLEVNELYDVTGQNGDILPRGDESYQYIKLDVPVHLYTEKYDLVYVSEERRAKNQEEF